MALLLVTPVSTCAAIRAKPPTLKHLYTVDRYGANLSFLTPSAVFLNSKRQELNVCDSGTGRLITFSAAGESLGYFSHRQKGHEKNSEPVGIATNGKGTVFVADATVGRVYKYDYRGEPLGYLSMPSGQGTCLPGKMAIDAADNLYVAARNEGKIVVFNPSGQVKTEITDSVPGRMKACCDVAVEADGTVYALSPDGAVVHVFDRQGKVVRTFGRHDYGKSGFARPSGIDVDGKGRIWITDMVCHRLSLFQPDGTFIAEFGGLGAEPGSFFSPVDVCVDRTNEIVFVVEKNGRRLQAFSIEEH